MSEYPSISESDDEKCNECALTFMRHDYVACLELLHELIFHRNLLFPPLLCMDVISRQRMGFPCKPEEFVSGYLSILEADPFERSLLLLQLGKADLRNVLSRAEDAEQRCRAHYYIGARLLTQGEDGSADSAFQTAIEQGVECLERDLADAELCYPDFVGFWAHDLDDPIASTRRLIQVLSKNLGAMYGTGRYRDALPLANRLCAMARPFLLGVENEPGVYANITAVTAYLHSELGEFEASKRRFQEALETAKAAGWDEHPVMGVILDNHGTLCLRMGDLAGARESYERAGEVLGKCAAHDRSLLKNVAINKGNLAILHGSTGDLGRAIDYNKEAISIQRIDEGQREHLARSLQNLGVLYGKIGDAPEAEKLCREAADIRFEVLGPDHPDVGIGLLNLADCLREAGKLEEAMRYYQQAGAIHKKGDMEDTPSCATVLNGLGLCYLEMGMAAATAEDGHPELPAFSDATIRDQALHRSEQLFMAARDVYHRAVGQEHRRYAEPLHNLALLRMCIGDCERAGPLCREVIEIEQHQLGSDHATLATSYGSMATVCAATHRLDEAMTWLKRNLEVHDKTMAEVFAVASERVRMGYLESIRSGLDATLSFVLQYRSAKPADVLAAFDAVLRRKGIAAEVMAVQRDAVLGGRYRHLQDKLGALSQLRMHVAQKALAGPGPEGLQAHHRTLAEWNDQKECLEADLARQIPEMSLEERLRAADCRAVALGLPEGVALVEFVRFPVFDFQAVPLRGEPRWKPARYLAFVLLAGEPDNVQMIDLGEAEPIDRMIADFRAGITGQTENRGGRDLGAVPGDDAEGQEREIGSALRAAVLDKLNDALRGRRRLLLSPDGDLTRLPFEALPTGDGRRLIDDYHFSYVATGRDVLRFGAESSGQPAEPLIVADPDFDLCSAGDGVGPGPAPSEPGQLPVGRHSRDLNRERGVHFGRLPGSRAEGEHIAGMLKVQPWLEADALEARLKAYASPRILHLATHGFFLEGQKRDPNKEMRDLGALAAFSGGPGRLAPAGIENPLLRSGLALSGANTWLADGRLPPEAEDGILTAEDVSGLDLLATELVVLSACETGLGEIRTGEGVFGLRRAFVLAGAKTLVMSLWKVPDQQTQELMEDFYRRILAGEPRAEALRQAQLSMKAKHPNPLYWGAFICQGDPSPLVRPK